MEQLYLQNCENVIMRNMKLSFAQLNIETKKHTKNTQIKKYKRKHFDYKFFQIKEFPERAWVNASAARNLKYLLEVLFLLSMGNS